MTTQEHALVTSYHLSPPTAVDLRSGLNISPDLKGAIVWMGDCKEGDVVGIAVAPIVCIAVMSFSCTGMAVVAFVDDKVADLARETAVETALWTVEVWKTYWKTMRRRARPIVLDRAAQEVDPAIVSQPLDVGVRRARPAVLDLNHAA